MPNTKQENMEQMSYAYISALCARNGFSFVKPTPDNDGVDLIIQCKGKPDPGCRGTSPSLHAQLKASYANVIPQEDGGIKYRLEAKNYNILVDESRITPIILIVLWMEQDENDWLECTKNYLKLTKCAFWVSLKGLPPTENAGTKTITIPSDNWLTCDSLKELMIKACNREEL